MAIDDWLEWMKKLYTSWPAYFDLVSCIRIVYRSIRNRSRAIRGIDWKCFINSILYVSRSWCKTAMMIGFQGMVWGDLFTWMKSKGYEMKLVYEVFACVGMNLSIIGDLVLLWLGDFRCDIYWLKNNREYVIDWSINFFKYRVAHLEGRLV